MSKKFLALVCGVLLAMVVAIQAGRGPDVQVDRLQASELGSVPYAHSISGVDSAKRGATTALEPRVAARAQRLANRAARQQQRRLQTPAARRERAESRTAFRGLPAPQALAAVEREQAAFIERPTSAAPTLKDNESIAGYLGPHTAVVERETKGGRTQLALAEASGEPLAVPVQSGPKKD